jgi:hypothetical protein
MKKLILIGLMLAFAAPTMAANGTDQVPIGGGLGAYCIITGETFPLNLEAPTFVGHVLSEGTAYVSTNEDATIMVSISAEGQADRVIGTVTKHSLVAAVYWNATGTAVDTVVPPEIGAPHKYTVDVIRAGLGDPDDEYTGVITLEITCGGS